MVTAQPSGQSLFLRGLCILLIAQVLGELIVRLLHVPVPGQLPGLVIGVLLASTGLRAAMTVAAVPLLRYLPLFLIPIAAGLADQGTVLRTEGARFVIAAVSSTLITLVVVRIAFDWAVRWKPLRDTFR